MFEELLISGSEIKTDNQKIFKANETFINQETLIPILQELQDCIQNYDNQGILNILTNNVEGFKR